MLRSLALLPVLAACLFAQDSFQTLPQGLASTPGGNASNWPVNTVNDQVWQWHYDASEFETQAPITISDIAMRPSSPVGIAAFNFASWRVTLIEASVDYQSGETEFARRILRSKVCRTGPWTGGPLIPLPGATVGGFLSMALTDSFTYDPSTGNDFIIQIEKCGTNATWGTTLDLASGPLGTVGGQRRGHTTDCTSPTSNTLVAISNAVPVVRIRYRPASQTLPSGFDQVDGNGSVGWPFTTSTDQKWHWHYDSSQFDAGGPIVITELWVRPRNPASFLGAFSFTNVDVTLATAFTNYVQVQRWQEFGLNIVEQRLARTGPWSGGPVVPSAGNTATWVPLQLQTPFVYDPTLGHDFIVQIETCGGGVPWSTTMDGRFGGAGTQGGNRYGHNADCTALFENTVSLVNDFVPIVRIDYQPLTTGDGAVTRFPWREDFETPIFGEAPRGWHNVEGEAFDPPADWVFTNGSTPSNNTGPNGDHTTGSGRYAYVEDSLSDNGRIALLSPTLDLSALTIPTLAFWVHSRNAVVNPATENTLSVDVLVMPSGPFVEDVLTVGHLGVNWNEQTVDLSPWTNERVRLRFRVDNDNGTFSHDIAIDDLRVFDPSPQFGQAPTTLALLNVDNGWTVDPGALEANGLPVALGVPGPYVYSAAFGERFRVTIEGTPNQPILLWTGQLNIGSMTFPGSGQLDVGLAGFVAIIDGLSGAGLIPGFLTTDAAGRFTLSDPWTVPPGIQVPLQAAVITGGAVPFAISNAVVIESL